MLDAVRVFQRKLKELCCPQGSIKHVFGGDGLIQHVGDALGLDALPVGINNLQVPGVLNALFMLTLLRETPVNSALGRVPIFRFSSSIPSLPPTQTRESTKVFCKAQL